ncbi:hypothetical protein [Flavobacterium beibuense]|uniref:Uncharacterized protein n=1 Tax=Flavobacterium beibuense TaxID=657326 RepID=A0A444WHU8_9FLAO|nr:hypothetical protein [Flavobacterium beibuense]RYJ45431.1 hypothetical protein NU09_0023 [Flavobacterium beibuense]
MEIKKLQELEVFASLLTKATEFNMLKPYHNREDMYTAKLFFSGYNDLNLAVMDIVKVCITALYAMEESGDDRKLASALTIAEVLQIALDLMPMEESQLLDNCYKLHLKLKEKEAESE